MMLYVFGIFITGHAFAGGAAEPLPEADPDADPELEPEPLAADPDPDPDPDADPDPLAAVTIVAAPMTRNAKIVVVCTGNRACIMTRDL
jgi:hypothetical protein